MRAPVPPPRALDDLDRRLIGLLRQGPRRLNTELAVELQVGEATVAQRIRALELDGAIRISAQRDFRAAGLEVLASVDVGVRGRPLEDVARDIAEIEGVCMVTVVMGELPLMLLVVASDLTALHELVSGSIAVVRGVARIETMLITEILEYRTEFAALTGRGPA